MTAILAIDQGTTNTKAVVIDGAGRVVGGASRPTAVTYPRPGWAEQDGIEIWRTVQAVIAEAADLGTPIAGLAITNQRETIGVWDARTGQPAAPFVLWQCRRSSSRCAELRAQGYEPDVVARTGLALDPLFSGPKLDGLLRTIPDGHARARAGELKAGTIDSWLIWNLTGGKHATDHSNAARTQLMNLDTLAWDETLADLFSAPLAMLPEILPSDAGFGRLAAGATALPAGTPICAAMGDSHAALFGHGFEGPGQVKATCGTGSSLMTATERRVWSAHGLSSTVAWSQGDRVLHALEGNISVSGHAAAFATSLLGLPDEEALTRLALEVEHSDGVCFVPALAGLGAPHWRDTARGVICGMSLSTRPAHIARAALEAVALQIRDVFAAMEADLHAPLSELSIDGGAARNDLLAQLLADLLDRPVRRPAQAELSALGVARMAAPALGVDLRPDQSAAQVFEPRMSPDQRSEIIDRWRDGLARTAFPESPQAI